MRVLLLLLLIRCSGTYVPCRSPSLTYLYRKPFLAPPLSRFGARPGKNLCVLRAPPSLWCLTKVDPSPYVGHSSGPSRVALASASSCCSSQLSMSWVASRNCLIRPSWRNHRVRTGGHEGLTRPIAPQIVTP